MDAGWRGMRLSDADRDEAVSALSEHYAAGRLTREEYDERTDAAWTALVRADLVDLFEDLPSGSAATQPPARRQPPRRLRRMPLPVGLMIALVFGFAVVTHLPWLLLAFAVWFIFGRHWVAGRHGCAQASGRRRPSRGSWA